MRVLVVEDAPEVGAVLRDFLLELGHEPVLVRTAEAALGLLNRTRPDAIVLDVHLPGMSGLDFLRLRPVRDSEVPVVALSGVATEEQARECLRLGAVDFLDKPVGFERLHAVLACVEPHAMVRHRAEAAERGERRQAPRPSITVPVRVTEYNGSEWNTYSMNVSRFGIKVRTAGDVRPGAAAKLTFAPDGGTPMQVMSLLVRNDLDGHAFYFVNVTDRESERLSALTALS